MPALDGLAVAILATDGVEQSELTVPRAALQRAGASTVLVSPREHPVTGRATHLRALDTLQWQDEFAVDAHLEDARPDEFDALYLPGGIINPDLLRLHPGTAPFVRAVVDAGKPVASMCHGPWNLVDADVLRGRTLTSWRSLAQDLRNAGAVWVDEQVVVDGWLVTCRDPGDLDAFCPAVVDHFAQVPARQEAGR